MKEYEGDLFSVNEELKSYADEVCKSAEKLQLVFEKTGGELWVFEIARAEVMEEILNLLDNAYKLCQFDKDPYYKKFDYTRFGHKVNPYMLPSAILKRRALKALSKLVCFNPSIENNLNNKRFKKSVNNLLSFVSNNYNDLYLKKKELMSISNDSDNASHALMSFSERISDFCFAVINEPYFELLTICDDDEKFEKAIANTFRIYSETYRKDCLNLLKVQARRFKENHTGGLKEMEQMMYDQVLEGILLESKDKSFNALGDDFKNKVQNCKALVEKLDRINVDGCLWLCNDDNENSVDMTEVYEALDTDNFLIFCILALRHNLIQCEVYPELKPKFEAWLKGKVYSNNEPEKSNNPKVHRTAFELSEVDKRDLGEILSLLKKGAWSVPAKEESVTELIEVLYGARQDELDEDDWDNARMFREFFRTGKSSRNFTRLEISTANIVGYFMECGYLPNSPKKASNQIFGKGSCDNNINKGKKNNKCDAFGKLIPYIDKYRLRLIEKHD